jgi:superfamily I DNA/RNA helicase
MDLWPDDPNPTLEPEPAISDIVLSPQQAAIMDWVDDGSGSAFVEAVAGSGKTTTLIEACKRMSGSVALLAFNKKIADEIKMRIRGVADNVRAGTFHSFGLAAWKGRYPKVRVDARAKSKAMIAECKVPYLLQPAVKKLVSLAKQAGAEDTRHRETEKTFVLIDHLIDRHDVIADVDTRGMDQEAIADVVLDLGKYAVRCLEWSREAGSHTIDYDDMIWLPVTTQGASFTYYDWVLVDEAQDTNTVRRMLSSQICTLDARTIWVGDRHQAIYGFTGADANAIDIIIKKFDCTSLPLTTTYRCPKAVVRVAQQWVSHIEAHESAPEGLAYTTSAALEECNLVTGDAILCRNTRPLVSLALALTRRGKGCHVEGHDIGQGLIRMATQWKVQSVAGLIKNLEAYRIRETERLRAREADYAIEALNDRIDTLLVITDGCDTVAELTAKIDGMFQNTTSEGKASTIILSTVHKAKGREWDRVFILGFDIYMPSKWAKKSWQKDQETNLMYVAATRARKELVMQIGDLKARDGVER